ncbi:MAG: hypothetical protein JWL95_3235 [Gemmatimonadetes bacterium]|nr:hypothetical protein [Gemmatimonadota bacterium]
MPQQIFPSPAVRWAQQQLSQYGQVGATQIVIVPALSAPIPAGAGVLRQPPQLSWPDPGTIIAMYGQVRKGDSPAYAQMDVRLQFPGDRDFITNGNAGDFAPMLALFGPNTNWFSMLKRVKRADNWQLTYRNQDTVNPAFPSVLFAFIGDADLPALEAEYQAAMAEQAARRAAAR